MTPWLMTLKVSINNHKGNLHVVYFTQVSQPKSRMRISSSPYMPHATPNSFLRLLIDILFRRYSDVLTVYHVTRGCRYSYQFSGKFTITAHDTTHCCGKCHLHIEFYKWDRLLIRCGMMLTSFCSLTFKQTYKMQIFDDGTRLQIVSSVTQHTDFTRASLLTKMPYIFMAQV